MIGIIKRTETYKKISASHYYKLINGSFWSVLGAIIFRGSSLISAIFVARIIGKESFGQFGIIQSTVGTLAVLIGLGIGMTSTKYIAEYRENDLEKLSKILSLLLIITYVGAFSVTILINIFKEFVALNLLGSLNLSQHIFIASTIIFFNIINSVQTSTLSGFEAFKIITKINIITGAASFPTMLVFTYFYGLFGTLTAISLISFLTWILNVFYTLKKFKSYGIHFNLNKSKDAVNVLKSYTLPATLSGALPTIWIGNIILVNSSESYSGMAYLNIANNWHTLVMFLPLSIGPVILSLLSNKNKSDKKEYWQIVKVSLFLNTIITVVTTIIIFFLSDIIVSFYGEGYKEAKYLLVLMTSVTILKSINHVIGQVIATASSMWLGFGLNFIWGIVYLGVTIVFVDKYGSLAIGLANIIAYIILLIVSLKILKDIKKSQ